MKRMYKCYFAERILTLWKEPPFFFLKLAFCIPSPLMFLFSSFTFSLSLFTSIITSFSLIDYFSFSFSLLPSFSHFSSTFHNAFFSLYSTFFSLYSNFFSLYSTFFSLYSTFFSLYCLLLSILYLVLSIPYLLYLLYLLLFPFYHLTFRIYWFSNFNFFYLFFSRTLLYRHFFRNRLFIKLSGNLQDISWIIPGKFIAFSGPISKRRQIRPGVSTLLPEGTIQNQFDFDS